MDEKLKSENMQKEQSSELGWGWVKAGVENGAMLTTIYLFRYTSECTVSLLDSGAVGPGFKSQPRRSCVTVLGKLFTSSVLLFTKQQNW